MNSVRLRLRWEEIYALPVSVHLWWALALKEDSVSDGIQEVVEDDRGFNLRTLGDGKANVRNGKCGGYWL